MIPLLIHTNWSSVDSSYYCMLLRFSSVFYYLFILFCFFPQKEEVPMGLPFLQQKENISTGGCNVAGKC